MMWFYGLAQGTNSQIVSGMTEKRWTGY